MSLCSFTCQSTTSPPPSSSSSWRGHRISAIPTHTHQTPPAEPDVSHAPLLACICRTGSYREPGFEICPISAGISAGLWSRLQCAVSTFLMLPMSYPVQGGCIVRDIIGVLMQKSSTLIAGLGTRAEEKAPEIRTALRRLERDYEAERFAKNEISTLRGRSFRRKPAEGLGIPPLDQPLTLTHVGGFWVRMAQLEGW